MKTNSEIIKETIDFIKGQDASGDDPLRAVGLITGALFAYMGRKFHPDDCVEFIDRAMKQIGWKE